MKEHTSKMMAAVPLQASESCTTTLATKVEKRILNVVQRQKDNISAGIPEIHCTTAVGTQLRCSNSIRRLGSLHCRSSITQQKLCYFCMLEFRQSWVQCLHYGLFNRDRLTGGLVQYSFPSWISLLCLLLQAVKETTFLCSQVTSPGRLEYEKKPSKQFIFNLHIILFSRQWMCLRRSLNVWLLREHMQTHLLILEPTTKTILPFPHRNTLLL